MIVDSIRFIRDQGAIVDIHNLTELSLLVKSAAPIGQNDIGTWDLGFGSWSLPLIICPLSLSYIFPETELYLVSVKFFLRRTDDREDLQFRQFFLELGECVIDDVLFQFQLVCIA